MKQPVISYENFEKHINAIREVEKLQDNISSAIKKFNNKNGDFAELNFPSLSDNIIDLLALITNDTEGWINYWIYELEYGNEYEDGCITDKNGNNIKLKTIKDLWKFINMED